MPHPHIPFDASMPFTAKIDRYAGHDIGEWTYGEPRVLTWDDKTKLKIGRFCSIADGVTILLGGEHRTDWVTTYPFTPIFDEARVHTGLPHSKGDVVVGNDVWIGYGATILSGVSIGDGAVVGAGSVVSKSIAPYWIAGGNPARPIKRRFPDDVADALLRIAWWNWPLPRIKEAWPLLLSPDVREFIRRYSA